MSELPTRRERGRVEDDREVEVRVLRQLRGAVQRGGPADEVRAAEGRIRSAVRLSHAAAASRADRTVVRLATPRG